MRSILHIITGLGDGGAEGVLCRLSTADRENRHQVISLMDDGVHGQHLRERGVEVHTLEMERGRLTLAGLVRLYRLIRAIDPDVVQTWMYHADLVGGLIARLAGKRALVWGLRLAYFDPTGTGPRTRRIATVCARLSSLPRRIVSCSARAAELHMALGYRRDRMVVIPNGYDLTRFAPDPDARRRLREEWAIGPTTVVIGMVARWDPQKDHPNLFAALSQLEASDWRCALVGTGMSRENAALRDVIARHGLEGRVALLGPRRDVPAVMNALDLHVLSSLGEGFPNVVAEAMACGTPCVATDAGDAGGIIGETGWLVPPADPTALTQALNAAIREIGDPARRERRQAAARERVVEQFGLERMVRNYRHVWEEAAAKRG